MNKNIGIVIGVLVLVVLAGSIYASMNSGDNSMMAKDKMEQQALEDQKMTEEKAMMEKEETSMMEKSDMMTKAGSYEVYSGEKIIKAASGDVVLFFRASWCPSCIGVDKDIKANLGRIPGTLTILDVNYDNSSDLKKKYGVTYQHTFVQVDKDGKMIKKWSGSPTLASLVSEVQ